MSGSESNTIWFCYLSIYIVRSRRTHLPCDTKPIIVPQSSLILYPAYLAQGPGSHFRSARRSRSSFSTRLLLQHHRHRAYFVSAYHYLYYLLLSTRRWSTLLPLVGITCYDKHALRADAPIPRMFFSPLVLWRYSTYAWLIRTPSFHPSYHSCVNPCFPLAIVLHIYDTLFPCSRYVSSLFTNAERP